jgi:hypothetical protein
MAFQGSDIRAIILVYFSPAPNALLFIEDFG